MKVDRPDGTCATASCQTDAETDLIYVSLEATMAGRQSPFDCVSHVTLIRTSTGTHKAQIIFNAYPVQSRRCKIVVVKSKGVVRAGKKTEREMLREMKQKRMKKEKKRRMDLSGSGGRREEGKGKKEEEKKKEKVKAEEEILEKKRLMEAKLGHTVRVGAQSIVDRSRDGEESERMREIDEKLRIMQEELGRPVMVRRGRAATATALEAPKAKKGGKLTEEIQQKKELMELVLGSDVHVAVQQVHIEDARGKG